MYQEYGDEVYNKDTLKEQKKKILEWCEEHELELNNKAQKKLLDINVWEKHKYLVLTATTLMQVLGKKESSNFNAFKAQVDKTLKAQNITLSASDKNAILNAVSWYDETAEKVIKKTEKLSGDKLSVLLEHLGCKEIELADFGYYTTDKKGEYIIYESNADLRDSESVPLKDEIYRYFLAEVKPHVEEAWINMESTKIGYEISFNKYFYQHKPLRSMDAIAKDIIKLEQQAEGLIAEILGVSINEVQA